MERKNVQKSNLVAILLAILRPCFALSVIAELANDTAAVEQGDRFKVVTKEEGIGTVPYYSTERGITIFSRGRKLISWRS